MLALLCGLSLTMDCGAGNLLVNPDFDSNIDGWSDLFSRWTHRSDEGSLSGPGSAECSASGSICQLTQCVETNGEFASLLMHASFRNLAGAATQSFSLSVLGFAGSACTDSNAESLSVTQSAVGSGEWVAVAGRFSPTQPTTSVRFGLNCGGAAAQACLADDAALMPSLTLFADGFESPH